MNKLVTVKSGEPIGPLGPTDKNKQWQRELLMERLRTHSSQPKTFQELSKSMRMSMLEKRYALDAVEKSNLQKCLDSMQHCIKVTSRQGLVERLESLSRQLGLKFMEDTSGLFISSDMFYLEIILDSDGTLSDVKVHHECKIEQQSCSELVTCLLKGDFADFTIQLEGLSSIYQLNAEPKVKSKAFVALQAMETDLYNLFTMQKFPKDTQALLMDSSVGIVQKRRGGHSMKLVYFVSPYDLLNLDSKSMQSLTLDLISSKNIGMNVAVNLEASSANKIQILPTVTFNKDMQGESVPVYSPMNAINSTLLPATFVLRLNSPLPICKSLMSTLTHLNDSNVNDVKTFSIMDLIVQTVSDGQIKNSSKGLPVNLPDQNHLYYFTENKAMMGSVVKSIPYTEPSQVPKILNVLRKQALFHTLLASCVRPMGKMGDIETMTILEVNAISITHVSVSLEHPFEESMATIEIDFSDGKDVQCNIYSMNNNYDGIALKLSKIVQKSFSIPIAIRALLKYWEQERLKGYHRAMENGNFNLALGPNDPGGRGGSGSGGDFREMKIKNERGGSSNIGGTGNFAAVVGGAGRQFFHGSGIMLNSNEPFATGGGSNLSMFEASASIDGSRITNQFGMKSSHDSEFQDQVMSGSGNVTGFHGEDFYKGPKSSSNKAETFRKHYSTETSDSSSLGASKSKSDSGVTPKNVQKVFDKGANGTALNKSNISHKRVSSKGTENSKLSSISKGDSSSNSSLSITSMSANELNTVLTGMGLEKRPGIEIIPITSSNTQNFQTSITITPIAGKSEKKHGSVKKSDDKLRNEKKRKRRKDDESGQMGPPEKLISKFDSANRPSNTTPKKDHSQMPTVRKHSTSSSMVSNSSGSGTNVRPSPKHSPVYSSPKGQSGSPKHALSGSSGKPSMLALKTVTNSISPKNDRSNTKSQFSKDKEKERERDRERVTKNLGATSPKIKTSTVKLKQIDLSAAFLHNLESGANDEDTKMLASQLLSVAEGLSPATLSTISSLVQCKNRKGSLSAVIDKLKLAQTTGEDGLSNLSLKCDGDVIAVTDINEKSQQSACNSSYKVLNQNPNSSTAFGSEYMIKPSLDGMKITINKTRSKETLSTQKISNLPVNTSSLKFPLTSGSGSPKRTGLKPGVSSGPASKKSVVASLLKSSAPASSSSQPKSFQRTNSAGSLTTKGPLSAADVYRKDKSIKGGKGTGGDSKQVNNRPDPMDVMKILRLSSPNSSMDGFMKSLNTKFQIPKLSARVNEDSKKDASAGTTQSSTTSSNASISTTVATTITTIVDTSTVSTSVSGSNSSNSESTKQVSIDNGIKVHQQTSSQIKLSSETNQQSQGVLGLFGKGSHLFSSTSPKYGSESNASFSKELSHLSKSSSSDAILGTFQKDSVPIIKQHSISTPSTPMHVASPFTSPVGAIMNSSPAYRTSPSTSPNVQNVSGNSNSSSSGGGGFGTAIQNDDSLTMRPPSAPCAVDTIKTGNEIDYSASKSIVTTTAALVVDQRQNVSSSTSSLSIANNKKLNMNNTTSSHTIVSHKMPVTSPSSSVSIHIVKSPVPSPMMLLPSPHSNSPCITDEEMIDESLVGIKGK